MRHCIATEYVPLDVAPRDMYIFFKHMGHSESINENIYQCLPALREITHVGKVLTDVDTKEEGKHYFDEFYTSSTVSEFCDKK